MKKKSGAGAAKKFAGSPALDYSYFSRPLVYSNFYLEYIKERRVKGRGHIEPVLRHMLLFILGGLREKNLHKLISDIIDELTDYTL